VPSAWQPCNVSPSLSYLRSALKSLLVKEDKNNYVIRTRSPYDVSKELLFQPLLYSFYVQNVLQPYRFRLPEANAPSTSFCYLDREHSDGYRMYRDAAVCFPDSDESTEGGTCVPCNQLEEELKKGRTKDEARMSYLNATCDPKIRGPVDPIPHRNKNEARLLRWFLESSYVFEGKKAGDNCNASTYFSKARAYVDVLMKKHFGGKTNVSGSLSLTTPGMEGEGEESLYEEVRAELSDDKYRMLYMEKLNGISRYDMYKVFCSREEELLCVEGKCRDCGDEVVKRNEDLMEACHPKNEGGKDRKLMMSPEFTVILGIFSTILGSFRW
jgi:hypothetical protein